VKARAQPTNRAAGTAGEVKLAARKVSNGISFVELTTINLSSELRN